MSTTPDQTVQVRGFKVMIDQAGTGGDPDSSWRRVSGGAECLEVRNTSMGVDQIMTYAPGAAYVTPLVLEGGLTAKRKAMIDWINATTKGENPRRTVTIQPLDSNGQPIKSYVYGNCLIEEVTIPELHAENHTLLEERITIRAENLTIQ
jgi:phage tail-like protein